MGDSIRLSFVGLVEGFQSKGSWGPRAVALKGGKVDAFKVLVGMYLCRDVDRNFRGTLPSSRYN